MLQRVLEPEVMDSTEDAREYDSMDHSAVNAVFVDDLLTAFNEALRGDWSRIRPGWMRAVGRANRILDLGAGTAQIPIELLRRLPHSYITAVDAAEQMLALAQKNIAAAGLTDRIELIPADAKHLPFDDTSYDVVISNSIVHHIPEPGAVFAEAIRVTSPGGLLFHRDLARPADESQLEHFVANYAGDATPYQRKLFADSLRASLTVEEVQALVGKHGFAPETVQMTSDRHWTWVASIDDNCRSQ
jgi:ubiquinone/menaquinone biosynthesis C-methylase UbiE